MSFFQLVRREMQGSLGRLVFVSAMGGLSTTSILGAINAGAQAADKGQISLWAAGLFIVALLLFIQTQHYILITTTAEIGAIIHKLRVRLMDYVRRSELLPLETIGRAEIVSAITSETATLTQASNMLAFAVQGALLIILVTAYVAYLSFFAFVLSIVIVGIGAAIFHSKTKQHAVEMREASAMGKSAVRSPERRARRLQGGAAQPGAQRRAVRSRRRRLENRRQHQDPHPERNLSAHGAAADLALHPARLGGVRRADVQRHGGPGSITKAVTALVFIVGACSGLVQSIPIIAAANTAADRLAQLEVKLAADRQPVGRNPGRAREEVSARSRCATSNSTIPASRPMPSFKVGPFNFTLNSGDLVILTGGNGSGKSTFMKMLAGLLPAGVGRTAARWRAGRRRPL